MQNERISNNTLLPVPPPWLASLRPSNGGIPLPPARPPPAIESTINFFFLYLTILIHFQSLTRLSYNRVIYWGKNFQWKLREWESDTEKGIKQNKKPTNQPSRLINNKMSTVLIVHWVLFRIIIIISFPFRLFAFFFLVLLLLLLDYLPAIH